MRIHTELSERELREMLRDVGNPLLELTAMEHRSRSHLHAFEVRLEFHGEKVKGDGRYRRNPGKSGGGFQMPWAATYDEWGEWLARIFQADPNAKATYYRNKDDFHNQTKGKYAMAAVA